MGVPSRYLNGGQLNGVQVRVARVRRQRGLTAATHQRRSMRGAPVRHHREDIVERAVRVLDDYGLASLTMRRLGSELGLQASAIYHHFPSKQALLAAVADEVLARGRRPRTGAGLGRPARRGLLRAAGRDAGLPRRRGPGGDGLRLRPRRPGTGRRAGGDPRPRRLQRLARGRGRQDAAALRLRAHLRGADRAPGGERRSHRRARRRRPGRGLRPRARAGARRTRRARARRPGASGADVDLGAVQLREQHGAGEVEPRPPQPGGRQVHPVQRRAAQVGLAQPGLPQGGPVEPGVAAARCR